MTRNEARCSRPFEVNEGKTVIMIAHRLSSIRNVERDIGRRDRKVTERGSHDELMKKDSKYKNLSESMSVSNEWRLS